MNMDAKIRSRIAQAFNEVGLDGNGRFEKPDNGYAAALEILSFYGIEMDEVVNAFAFTQPEGRITVNLAWTNERDSFSPDPIPNSILVLSWHRFETTGQHEVLAYLS